MGWMKMIIQMIGKKSMYNLFVIPKSDGFLFRLDIINLKKDVPIEHWRKAIERMIENNDRQGQATFNDNPYDERLVNIYYDPDDGQGSISWQDWRPHPILLADI